MFYGWKLCGLCSLGNLLIQGTATYGMNAFIEPLCSAHGWSRTAVSSSMGLAALVGFASVPLIGTLAMRFSIRSLMAFGAVLAGLALAVMGQSSNYALFTIAFCVLWVASQCCGGLAGNALICNWFTIHRGKAFGIASLGISLAGAVIPVISIWGLSQWGLPVTYGLLGGMAATMMIPCLMLIREHPRDMGLYPDNQNGPELAPAPVSNGRSSWKMFLARKEIYLIGGGTGLGLMVASGMMSQLKPRFTELGFESYTAVTLASIAALACCVSKFFWGLMADRYRPLPTLRLLMALHIAALGMSFLKLGFVMTVPYCVFLGTCCGGYWTLLPAVVGFYFGQTLFLSAYRFVSFFVVLKSIAYPILGYSFDTTGSYDAGYLTYAVLVTAGLCLLMCLDERRAAEYKAGKA